MSHPYKEIVSHQIIKVVRKKVSSAQFRFTVRTKRTFSGFFFTYKPHTGLWDPGRDGRLILALGSPGNVFVILYLKSSDLHESSVNFGFMAILGQTDK